MNIRFFIGKEVYPRSVIETNMAFYLDNNHFRLIWKSDDVSFKKATEELKSKVTEVNKCILLDKVITFLKYEFEPNKQNLK